MQKKKLPFYDLRHIPDEKIVVYLILGVDYTCRD